MSLKIKQNILIAISSLLFSYVRLVIQNGTYNYGSLSFFIGAWVMHLIALLLLGGISFAVVNSVYPKFYPDNKHNDIESVDKFLTIFCLICIVTLIAILFLYHLPPLGDDYGY